MDDAARYFKVTLGASSNAKDFNRKKESLNFGVQSGSWKLEWSFRLFQNFREFTV